jgi:prepilin-type N-terminal cleavage/methylation domain-containing protein
MFNLDNASISNRPSSKHQPRQGFTLIEILVVISIVAVLTAIGFIGYTGVQRSARDGERITEVNEIAKAIELTKSFESSYPLYWGVASGMTALQQHFSNSIPTNPKIVGDLPADYWVSIENPTNFCVMTVLEDPKRANCEWMNVGSTCRFADASTRTRNGYCVQSSQ